MPLDVFLFSNEACECSNDCWQVVRIYTEPFLPLRNYFASRSMFSGEFRQTAKPSLGVFVVFGKYSQSAQVGSAMKPFGS